MLDTEWVIEGNFTRWEARELVEKVAALTGVHAVSLDFHRCHAVQDVALAVLARECQRFAHRFKVSGLNAHTERLLSLLGWDPATLLPSATPLPKHRPLSDADGAPALWVAPTPRTERVEGR